MSVSITENIFGIKHFSKIFVGEFLIELHDELLSLKYFLNIAFIR